MFFFAWPGSVYFRTKLGDLKLVNLQIKSMKTVFLIFCSILFSCGPAINKSEHSALSITTKAEPFNIFFEKFSNDSLFQISRIDNPLIVITSDEGDEIKELMDVKYVSFSQKDWKEVINITIKEISQDTTQVLLQAIDTGIYIEHVFTMRNQQWHLCKILNLST
jgi:hypothetical protein